MGLSETKPLKGVRQVDPEVLNQISEGVEVSQIILKTSPLSESFSTLTNNEVTFESFSSESKEEEPSVIFDQTIPNQFIATIHRAFQSHLPLILSPDAVWFVIGQGLSQCINQDPEAVRHVFVQHEGQQPLVLMHSPEWSSNISQFSQLIAEKIGESLHQLLVANFSTTTEVTKIVSELMLMETTKAYFTFSALTDCAIPQLQLEGTVADWELIQSKVEKLSQLFPSFNWWFSKMTPLLFEFVNLKKGFLNSEFWISFYKWRSESGQDEVSGHVNCLFPFLSSPSGQVLRNWYFRIGEPQDCIFPNTAGFPGSLCRVKFSWQNDGLTQHEFVGGLVGCSQNPSTYALKVKFAWGTTAPTG